MKPEQLDKLEQLQDKPLTVAVDDCDPENWTGYGQKPRDMDRETRGNAIYDRKLAGQTLACLVRVGNIINSADKGNDLLRLKTLSLCCSHESPSLI